MDRENEMEQTMASPGSSDRSFDEADTEAGPWPEKLSDPPPASSVPARLLPGQVFEVTCTASPESSILRIQPTPQALGLLGYSPSDSAADSDLWSRSLHPVDRESVMEEIKRCRSTGGPLIFEYRVLRKDGRWIWFRSGVCFAGGNREEPLVLQGVMVDITRQKTAEEHLLLARDLAISLGATSDLKEALDLVLEITLRVEGIDGGGVYLVDAETGQLDLVAHRGLSPWFVESASRPTEAQGRFVRAGRAAYWSRPGGILDSGEILEREGIRALAVIPVKSEDRVTAALNLMSRRFEEIPVETRSALETIAAQITPIVTRVEAEAALKRAHEELERRARNLEDLNSALRVLLRQRDEDRGELGEKILSNVKHLMLPWLERLKGSGLDQDQLACVEILEGELKEITSPFVRTLANAFLGLTPMEIRVAYMVKEGMGNKEVAKALGLSPTTVRSHREGLRRKLRLTGKKINLRTYLQSLT